MKDLLYKVNRRDNIAYGAIKVCECVHTVEIEEGDSEEEILYNMFDDKTAADIFNKKYDAVKLEINAYYAESPIYSSLFVFYCAMNNSQGVTYRTLYDGSSFMELLFHENSSGFVTYTLQIVKDEEEGN